MKNKKLFILSSIIWLGSMLAGTYYLLRYANTPGVAALPPKLWPVESSITQSSKTATLVLFGHPHCPCSKASVGELNEIIAKIHDRIRVYVAFVVPKDADESWQQSSLWTDAKLIPGVQTLLDEDGIESSRFNATTSGQAILYDENGQLVFSGGITDSRGHFGDNAGKSAIISYANGHEVPVRSTPVYGCALYHRHGDG